MLKFIYFFLIEVTEESPIYASAVGMALLVAGSTLKTFLSP